MVSSWKSDQVKLLFLCYLSFVIGYLMPVNLLPTKNFICLLKKWRAWKLVLTNKLRNLLLFIRIKIKLRSSQSFKKQFQLEWRLINNGCVLVWFGLTGRKTIWSEIVFEGGGEKHNFSSEPKNAINFACQGPS